MTRREELNQEIQALLAKSVRAADRGEITHAVKLLNRTAPLWRELKALLLKGIA